MRNFSLSRSRNLLRYLQLEITSSYDFLKRNLEQHTGNLGGECIDVIINISSGSLKSQLNKEIIKRTLRRLDSQMFHVYIGIDKLTGCLFTSKAISKKKIFIHLKAYSFIASTALFFNSMRFSSLSLNASSFSLNRLFMSSSFNLKSRSFFILSSSSA